MIELVVAIAIIGILVATTVFSVLKLRPDWTLNRAARNLYTHMQMARMGAVKDNANWAVEFDIANNEYRVRSPGPDSTLFTADDIIKTVRLADYGYGIQFGSGSATQSAPGGGVPVFDTFGGTAEFNSRGMLINTNGFVYMQNNSNLPVQAQSTRAIGARTSGVIRLVKWFEASQTWN